MNLRCSLVLVLAFAHQPALAAERTPAPGASRTAQPASLPIAASWITDASETVQPNLWILSHVLPPDYRTTCGTFLESKWVHLTKMTIQGYVNPERAYFQEKDFFGLSGAVGAGSGMYEGPPSVCWKYVVTLGHLSGAKPQTSWMIAAQPFRWYDNTPLPGPWYCVTNLAGAHPAFTLGVSPTGPIADGQACARQPAGDAWTPPASFFVPPIKKR